jgi:integrase
VLHQAETALTAYAQLQQLIHDVKAGATEQPRQRLRFGDWAHQLFERRVRTAVLGSAFTRHSWRFVLKCHLLPAFGDFYMDQLRRADVIKWREELAELVACGTITPYTANTRLKALKTIVSAWVRDHEAGYDPARGVDLFDASSHRTYTREQPNALREEEVLRFLLGIYQLYPQHFALAALGIATGWHTCSLRRQGPTPDLLLERGVLLNRRSATIGQQVNERTKTGLDQDIELPPEMLDLLRWHIDRLSPGPMQESELLFPGRTGKIISRSTLGRALASAALAVGLGKRFTPHGMRRTNKDLLRRAGVSQVVSMALSGHLTERMHEHYSTVSGEEMRQSIAKVVQVAGLQVPLAGKSGGESGVLSPGRQMSQRHQRRKEHVALAGRTVPSRDDAPVR